MTTVKFSSLTKKKRSTTIEKQCDTSLNRAVYFNFQLLPALYELKLQIKQEVSYDEVLDYMTKITFSLNRAMQTFDPTTKEGAAPVNLLVGLILETLLECRKDEAVALLEATISLAEQTKYKHDSYKRV